MPGRSVALIANARLYTAIPPKVMHVSCPAGGKPTAVQLWRSGWLPFFRERQVPAAHGDTNFLRWADASEVYALSDVNERCALPGHLPAALPTAAGLVERSEGC